MQVTKLFNLFAIALIFPIQLTSCKKELLITSFIYNINTCSPPYAVSFKYVLEGGNASAIEHCEWFLGDSLFSTKCDNVNLIIPVPGVYKVKLKITKGRQEVQRQLTVDASQSSYPITSSFTVNYPDIYQSCYVSFTNHSERATTYKWDFGDGYSSNAFEPTHQYASPGTYTVHLETKCSDQTQVSSKTVYVYNNPAKVYLNHVYLNLPQSYLDSDGDDKDRRPDLYWDIYLDNVYQYSTSTIMDVSSFPQYWYNFSISSFLASNHTITIKLYDYDPGPNNDEFLGSYYFTTAYLRNNCYPAGFWLENNVYCYVGY